MALHMAEKNRQAGQDLDRIFMQRKQREQETAQVPHSHSALPTLPDCTTRCLPCVLMFIDVARMFLTPHSFTHS